MIWNWKSFDQLTTQELYDILALRVQVFSVEQNCLYQDLDGFDQKAWHLWTPGQDSKTPIGAYLRAFPPGVKYLEASLGRVVTAPACRTSGLGKILMREGLARIEQTFGALAIRISAQAYLEKFYQNLGFQTVGEPYLEDGIPHIEMKR